jgi:ribosomal protein S18 acetylase RimI-like enzyme
MIALRAGTEEDAGALAPLIFSSATVLLPYLFKGRQSALNYILQAAAQPDGQYSAPRHQLAIDDKQVVACITLWDDKLSKSFHAYTLKSLTEFLQHDQIAHLLSNNELISSVFLAPQPRQLCVGHLAVLDTHKGLGIGKKLIAYAIMQAKKYDKKQLILDVDSTNEAALSFYNSLGFNKQGCNVFAPTNQSFYRMQYTL